MIEQFHFIRPLWLVAIIPLCIICALLLRRRLSEHNWQSEVDPALLPHLLITQNNKTSVVPVLLFFIAGLLAILAMSGPSWQKLPQPVYKKQSALMIVLDLSRSMDAIDLKPNRLQRAIFKISDILKLRQEGETGLIVYAEAPYIVSPMTEDTNTIEALLPSLSTDIMPAEGDNTRAALKKAAQLMNNAGFDHGDILLVSDYFGPSIQQSLQAMSDRGFPVSLLAVGTPDGAPIPLAEGGFLKNSADQVILPRLNESRLRPMIESAGGVYSQISVDDSDIELLMPLITIQSFQGETLETEIDSDIWREFGPWLLLIVAPLAALAFRRGYLIVVFLIILPLPQPASALSLNDLFTSNNDRAMALYNDSMYQEAAELFDDKQWQASAWYRARQYELSIRLLDNIDTAEAHYNRGDALTQQNEIAKAIDAFSKAIELDPEHEDAKYNKALLEKLQDEQQQQEQDAGKQESRNPQQQEEDDSKDSEASSGENPEQLEAEPGNEDDTGATKSASDNESQNERQSEQQDEPQEQQQEQEQQAENNEQGQSSEQDQADKQGKARPDQRPDENPDEHPEEQPTEKEQQQQSDQQPDQQPEQQPEQRPERQPEQQTAGQQDSSKTDVDKKSGQQDEQNEQQPLSDETIEQWLNKVPDDPGGLLRKKFKYLYKKQQQIDGKKSGN